MAQNLQVNYAAKHDAVLDKMERLKALLEDMPSPVAQRLTWADHG